MNDSELENREIVEDKEKVQQIAVEIMEPALQKALSQARATASPQEALSALANCYGGLLVDTLGVKGLQAFFKPTQFMLHRVKKSN